MSQEWSESSAEKFVIELLEQSDHLTTREIEAEASNRNLTCPDAMIRFLNKMKLKGLIKGKLSVEHRGWIWYIERSDFRDTRGGTCPA